MRTQGIVRGNRLEAGRVVPEHAKFVETRRYSCVRLQPIQSGAPPLLPRKLQAQPRRRSRRVARTRRGIRDSLTVLVETGSNWSDSTATHPYLCQRSPSFPVFPRFIGRLGCAICQRDYRNLPSWRDFRVLSPEAPSGASVSVKFPC